MFCYRCWWWSNFSNSNLHPCGFLQATPESRSAVHMGWVMKKLKSWCWTPSCFSQESAALKRKSIFLRSPVIGLVQREPCILCAARPNGGSDTVLLFLSMWPFCFPLATGWQPPLVMVSSAWSVMIKKHNTGYRGLKAGLWSSLVQLWLSI